jgi:hypothetical protein
VTGSIGDTEFANTMKSLTPAIISIYADGEELAYCCEILGRELPPKNTYVFMGDNAKEIAINW